MTSRDTFAHQLLAWFDCHGRHDLPWQHPRSPYRVWLSEIMLQQTQVAVVMPYFQRFVAALPDLPALAAADEDAVLALWSGLGYYSRARNLHATARLCMQRHGGELPRNAEALMALPGIGRSTAGAILAQAWGDRFAILDGNVRRVLCRYHGVGGWPGLPTVQQHLWELAESHLTRTRLADYTQAQMDLGATVCTRQRPACARCPLARRCVAHATGRTAKLPTPKPGKAIPQREAIVLLLRDAKRRVLLHKRPTNGVWAALWSLPQFETFDAAADWHRDRFHGTLDTHAALPAIRHAFTHYRLHLQPLQLLVGKPTRTLSDDAALRWFATNELPDLGIPAPIRTLLNAVLDD